VTPVDTQQLLERFYPSEEQRSRGRRWLRRITGRVKRYYLYLAAGLLLVAAWVAGHLYYYNKLVDMEYDVQEAWAQVETQWQRRYHIQHNLTRMVLEYSRHERELLMRLTKLRVGHLEREAKARGKPPAPLPATKGGKVSIRELKRHLERLTPGQLNKVFPQIQFMAEQYPRLRLSENFQQFSKATIETENKIAAQIKAYNQAVNLYTTNLMQFPGVIFGKACGFEPYDFYVPDRDKLKFRPVQLQRSAERSRG
jgi:LemA protein